MLTGCTGVCRLGVEGGAGAPFGPACLPRAAAGCRPWAPAGATHAQRGRYARAAAWGRAQRVAGVTQCTIHEKIMTIISANTLAA